MTDDDTTPQKFPLGEVLRQLGEQFDEVRGGSLSWSGATVEMDVSVESSGSGGIKLWVLSGDAGVTRTTSTKITIQLEPAAPADAAEPADPGAPPAR